MKNPVRVVVQDRDSLKFFKGSNEWTPEIDAATDFSQVVNAVDFILKTRLPHIDILMDFGDPRYEVRLKATG